MKERNLAPTKRDPALCDNRHNTTTTHDADVSALKTTRHSLLPAPREQLRPPPPLLLLRLQRPTVHRRAACSRPLRERVPGQSAGTIGMKAFVQGILARNSIRHVNYSTKRALLSKKKFASLDSCAPSFKWPDVVLGFPPYQLT